MDENCLPWDINCFINKGKFTSVGDRTAKLKSEKKGEINKDKYQGISHTERQ